MNRLSPDGHKTFLRLPPGMPKNIADWNNYDCRCFGVFCDNIVNADVVKHVGHRWLIIVDAVDYREQQYMDELAGVKEVLNR